ncbi:hypothetical protein B0H19DRAFT_939417, partial [Mycena capillaripes]
NPLLLRVLELSQYFLSQPTRELVLGVIKSRSYNFRPAELIHLSYKYHTKALFAVAFQRLASLRLRDLTEQDVDWMGMQTYVALARLKEALQQHRCILAAEAPEFDPVHGVAHGPDCRDHDSCSRDWRTTWWNGMGRFLLDGRNPLTWTDGMQQFEHLNFGEMDPTCRMKMLDVVRTEDGNRPVFHMIDGVSDKLIAGIEEVVHGEE